MAAASGSDEASPAPVWSPALGGRAGAAYRGEWRVAIVEGDRITGFDHHFEASRCPETLRDFLLVLEGRAYAGEFKITGPDGDVVYSCRSQIKRWFPVHARLPAGFADSLWEREVQHDGHVGEMVAVIRQAVELAASRRLITPHRGQEILDFAVASVDSPFTLH